MVFTMHLVTIPRILRYFHIPFFRPVFPFDWAPQLPIGPIGPIAPRKKSPGFRGNVHFANGLHPLLARSLFLQQLLLTYRDLRMETNAYVCCSTVALFCGEICWKPQWYHDLSWSNCWHPPCLLLKTVAPSQSSHLSMLLSAAERREMSPP